MTNIARLLGLIPAGMPLATPGVLGSEVSPATAVRLRWLALTIIPSTSAIRLRWWLLTRGLGLLSRHTTTRGLEPLALVLAVPVIMVGRVSVRQASYLGRVEPIIALQ